MNGRAPQLSIGADVWPGLAKLAEECGELIQVVGKLAAFPDGPHPDGSDLVARLQEELADVSAAIAYVTAVNQPGIDADLISRRAAEKISRFMNWHADERLARPAPPEPSGNACPECGGAMVEGLAQVVTTIPGKMMSSTQRAGVIAYRCVNGHWHDGERLTGPPPEDVTVDMRGAP